MHRIGMRRNVFGESLQQKCVNDCGFFVWHLLIPKTLVKLQRMARRAALSERWGRHITLARSGMQVVARARGRNSRIRREGHGFSRATMRHQSCGLQPLRYALFLA